MKKITNNSSQIIEIIFLSYCAIFASTITIAGFLTSKSEGDIIFQIIFLPVTIFFILTLVDKFRKKASESKETETEEKKMRKRYIVMSIMLVILMLVAIANILGN